MGEIEDPDLYDSGALLEIFMLGVELLIVVREAVGAVQNLQSTGACLASIIFSDQRRLLLPVRSSHSRARRPRARVVVVEGLVAAQRVVVVRDQRVVVVG